MGLSGREIDNFLPHTLGNNFKCLPGLDGAFLLEYHSYRPKRSTLARILRFSLLRRTRTVEQNGENRTARAGPEPLRYMVPRGITSGASCKQMGGGSLGIMPRGERKVRQGLAYQWSGWLRTRGECRAEVVRFLRWDSYCPNPPWYEG